MFNSWQSFYQMTGEAAATLIGLLFIVASLMAGRQSAASAQGVKLFTTPTVFHLASVLAISALTLIPDAEGTSRTLLMTAWAVFGLVHTAGLAARLRVLPNPTHWSDFWWYGAAPALVYLALAAASASTAARLSHAPYGVALCLLTLLLLTIRNAWDLVTWLAPRRDGL
jgi:hypothetical protein